MAELSDESLSTGSSESPDSDTSPCGGSDASSSDERTPTPTVARTAARQLGAHIQGPRDGDEIREGRTRAQTRALEREAASGLISLVGPVEGSKILDALLAVQPANHEPAKLPECSILEAEPEPTSFSAARSSQHSDVWMEAYDIRD